VLLQAFWQAAVRHCSVATVKCTGCRTLTLLFLFVCLFACVKSQCNIVPSGCIFSEYFIGKAVEGIDRGLI
jgi:O-antigen ligase